MFALLSMLSLVGSVVVVGVDVVVVSDSVGRVVVVVVMIDVVVVTFVVGALVFFLFCFGGAVAV